MLKRVADHEGPLPSGREIRPGSRSLQTPRPHNAAAGPSDDGEEDAAFCTCGRDFADGDFALFGSSLHCVSSGSLRALDYCTDYSTTIEHQFFLPFAGIFFFPTHQIGPTKRLRARGEHDTIPLYTSYTAAWYDKTLADIRSRQTALRPRSSSLTRPRPPMGLCYPSLSCKLRPTCKSVSRKNNHDGDKHTVESYGHDLRRDPRSSEVWAARSSR